MRYDAERLSCVYIGRKGENLARVVEFDVSGMLNKWPDAQITLLVRRRKEEEPYIARTTLEKGVLYWQIAAVDTEFSGNGLLEIHATLGDVLAKSAMCQYHVADSISGLGSDPPEPARSWVDEVIAAAARAQEASQALTRMDVRAETLMPGSQATVTRESDLLIYGIPRGDKGEQGPAGPPGSAGSGDVEELGNARILELWNKYI